MNQPQNHRTELPKSTPHWLRDMFWRLESEIEKLNKDKSRLMTQLGKTQEDFQDLFDLVERIAAGREPSVVRSCQEMINRINPGSYEEESLS